MLAEIWMVAALAAPPDLRPACLDDAGELMRVYGAPDAKMCEAIGGRFERVPVQRLIDARLIPQPEPPAPRRPVAPRNRDAHELTRTSCEQDRDSFARSAGTLLSLVPEPVQWVVEVTYLSRGTVVVVHRVFVETSPNGARNWSDLGPLRKGITSCEYAVFRRR